MRRFWKVTKIISSLINNINIAFENRDQAIDFEEIGSTD